MHVSPQTDLLVHQIKDGNENALATLYDLYGDALYGLILKIVRDEDQAQDVLQDCFVTIWKKVASYNPEKGSFFTWMLNICRNRAIDTLRKDNRAQAHQEEMMETGFISTATEALNVDAIGLKELIGTLSPEERLVIDYLYFRGYTQQEASEELEIPLGTIKTRVRGALAQLRKSFITLIALWILKNT
jgi:RNA polymerase sigma-70 factor (ECF subfamily)